MPSPRLLATARRTADRFHRTLGEEARRLREDAGLTRLEVGREAGIDPAYLGRIEDGRARPSAETLARLAAVLGADLVGHLYPNTGPAIRDRFQAPILEALLADLHPRWRPYPEVAVRRPARGWIDLVLHEPREGCLIAAEIQSRLPRLEQLVRWSTEKAAALPSWEGYTHLGPIATTSQLLIVRSTRETRLAASEFGRQLELAYPAHPADALEALSGTRAWPGAALVWVELRKDHTRFLRRR